MPKADDRPVDVGLASLKGQDEPSLVEWWKKRFALLTAIPVETARVGALTPQLRELTRIADDAERRKLTRARVIAFSQLPADQRALIAEARKRAWEVDKDVLQKDQALVEELLPSLDAGVRAAYPRPAGPQS